VRSGHHMSGLGSEILTFVSVPEKNENQSDLHLHPQLLGFWVVMNVMPEGAPHMSNFCAFQSSLKQTQHYESQPIYHWAVLSHAVAFMRFSQSAYSQDEDSSSLSVSLVLDPFGGSGGGSAEITQDIVEVIIAFAQAGDTATGKESMGYNY